MAEEERVMADAGVTLGKRALRPANENPWYVLMTLYGEQLEKYPVKELATKNREAWNAWACQGIPSDDFEKSVTLSNKIQTAKAAWPAMSAEVQDLHESEMRRRNGEGFSYPGLPDFTSTYSLGWLQLDARLVAENYIFWKFLDFRESLFVGDAFFRGCDFLAPSTLIACKFTKRAIFASCKFEGPADFFRADFQDLVTFNIAQFHESANFASVDFLNTADFEAAIFSGHTHFQDAKFETAAKDSRQRLNFSDCQFERPANFLKAKFKFKYPDFANTIFHDRTAFTAQSDYWPEVAKNDPEQAKSSCAVIRHTLAKQGLPEEEHFFFRKEMGFAGQVGGWWQRLPYRFFGAVSDYGYSIERPLLLLLGLWLGGAFVFLLSFRTCYCIADMQFVLQAMSLSFSNIFNFFGFQRAYIGEEFIKGLSDPLKVLGAVQTVLGFVLLFFLGLGLRTRFRMR